MAERHIHYIASEDGSDYGIVFDGWCPLDQPCHADVLLDVANRRWPW